MNYKTLFDSLTFICGPCVIESRDHTLKCAERIHSIFSKLGLPFVFKASFDKANRSSIHSFRGVGIESGLKILQEVKETFNVPVTSDIHLPDQAQPASEVLDILQIPAFLCRQTDLLVAAAKTGRIVNVKKGQFAAPIDMKNVVEKLHASGCEGVIITDRGTTFGYNNLITDLRAIPIIQSFGVPVCFDATHSLMLPGGATAQSGGQREFILPLAKGAVAAGANMVFLEAHDNPDKALSDSATQVPISELESLVKQLVKIADAR